MFDEPEDYEERMKHREANESWIQEYVMTNNVQLENEIVFGFQRYQSGDTMQVNLKEVVYDDTKQHFFALFHCGYGGAGFSDEWTKLMNERIKSSTILKPTNKEMNIQYKEDCLIPNIEYMKQMSREEIMNKFKNVIYLTHIPRWDKHAVETFLQIPSEKDHKMRLYKIPVKYANYVVVHEYDGAEGLEVVAPPEWVLEMKDKLNANVDSLDLQQCHSVLKELLHPSKSFDLQRFRISSRRTRVNM